MDVDAAPGQEGGQIVGKDLHITREDNEFGTRLFDDCLDARFLLGLGVLRDREVMEGNVADGADGEGRRRVI